MSAFAIDIAGESKNNYDCACNPNRLGYYHIVSQTVNEQNMTQELKQKIELALNLDTPSNYICWEDAEESIMEELTSSEAHEYCNSGDSLVEEWFIANSQ